MTNNYEAPAIARIGSLHELTLQTLKDLTGSDGTVLIPNIALGPIST